MTGWSIAFQPYLPTAVLAVLALLAAGLVAFGLWRRARGVWWRLAFLTLALLALANPVLRQEEREPLDDVVLVVADRSPSERLAERPAQIERALSDLRRELGEIGRDVEVREVEVDGEGRGGTELFGSLEEALAETDRERLGAIVAVTDGQVHDAPADPAAFDPGAPVHVLLTGRPDESDRQLVVERAPSFAVVGEPQTMSVRVDDRGPGASSGAVPLRLRRDGEVVREVQARPGRSTELAFMLDKAGRAALEIEVAERQGELTRINNRVAIFVNGVRDRLRVLLVSGQPYPGLRVWRNLLKADPAVDLVHFTILRPPEKQDGTPIRELALIAFPSRELFEVKLNEFDLIVFDRYSRRGLLPLVYLENIARYVEEGGALLEAAGPEFAEPLSLYRTPLSRVLPGRPSGEIYERGFSPALTEIGGRHPVTKGLEPPGAPGEPGGRWGRWFRQVDVETTDAQVLMNGVADRPLLVLDRVGEGRVAQLLSDHEWLWARGFEGGGPQAVLLRRLVHWLMKEPELEEEALEAEATREGIVIERQSLESRPVEVTVTHPAGREEVVQLRPGEDGLARGRVAAMEDGLYRISDGEHTAYATPRPIAPIELGDMLATDRIMAPVAEATGGGVRWLARGGTPDLRRVEPGRLAAGRGWLGIEQRGAYRVLGQHQLPLLPAWLALLLLAGTATIAWWREGRA